MGFEMGVGEAAIGADLAGKGDGSGDETLHQVALGWADVSFVKVNAVAAQQGIDGDQLAVLLAVQAQHLAMLKIQQLQGADVDARLVLEQRLDLLALHGRKKRDRRLHAQLHVQRPRVGCQPEFHTRALRGIAPMAGKDEALLAHEVGLAAEPSPAPARHRNTSAGAGAACQALGGPAGTVSPAGTASPADTGSKVFRGVPTSVVHRKQSPAKPGAIHTPGFRRRRRENDPEPASTAPWPVRRSPGLRRSG